MSGILEMIINYGVALNLKHQTVHSQIYKLPTLILKNSRLKIKASIVIKEYV